MNHPLFRISPAVKGVLLLWSGFYIASVIGELSGAFSLSSALALDSSYVVSGQVWRLFTHALLPAGFFDLLMGGLVLAWIGSRVESAWSRQEFIAYCALCVFGAGAIPCLVFFGSPGNALGTAAPAFAVLAAWVRLFGHETLTLTPRWRVRGGHLILIAGALILLFNLIAGSVFSALYLAAAALTGWIYLTVRWRGQRNQPAREVKSDRIQRLEL